MSTIYVIVVGRNAVEPRPTTVAFPGIWGTDVIIIQFALQMGALPSRAINWCAAEQNGATIVTRASAVDSTDVLR
jgi:hypothetical protein